MNVDAFPPVRSEATSGSRCGFTCHKEMILQTNMVRPGWPLLCSSSAVQARLQGLASLCLAPSLPPSGLSAHSRLQVMGSGLFPEALLFQHYTGLRETSNLSSSGGTVAFSCSSHRSVTIFTSGSW